MQKVKIKKSIEKISHFQCGKCKKWWTIGDASEKKKKWFCPWCGLEQEVVIK
ncbi:MAG: hypothetical protein ABIA91_03000 [Patescibacteria group bacterium]